MYVQFPNQSSLLSQQSNVITNVPQRSNLKDSLHNKIPLDVSLLHYFMTLHWTILLSKAKGLGTSKVYSTTMFVAITVHNMVVYTYIPGHITWLGQINQTEHLRSSKLQCKFYKRNKQCYIGLCIFFSGSSCDIQNLTFILKRISINTLMRQKICSYNEYGKEKQQFFWNEISQKSYEKESYNL